MTAAHQPGPAPAQTEAAVPATLVRWLESVMGWSGAVTLIRCHGGNSNQTYRLICGDHRCILRRPPRELLAETAHSMEREHRLLTALGPTAVPVPAALAYCADRAVVGAPFLLMELVDDAVGLTDSLPDAYGRPGPAMERIGEAAIAALAALHSVDSEAAGLADFGRPEGYLARQVPRWRRQYQGYSRRSIPHFDGVADWLDANRPQPQPPALLHGDFHLDNCLFDQASPELRAIVDWEMGTLGDPLVDIGLFLALWGERPVAPCAMPSLQAVTRLPGTPGRDQLAGLYARLTGRSLAGLRWYMAFALWKLAAIIEGAYTQHLDGRLDSTYSAALETEVPRLVEEAAHHAGVA